MGYHSMPGFRLLRINLKKKERKKKKGGIGLKIIRTKADYYFGHTIAFSLKKEKKSFIKRIFLALTFFIAKAKRRFE